MLGAEAIATVPAGYRLRPDTVEVDREEFQSLVARGRENAASGAPERAVALLEQALGLWHGRPFTELEEWGPGRLEAARLGELRLAVVEDLLQARLDAGDHRGVAAAATVATGEEPFRERRWAILALAQYRGRRQADALGSIRTARRVLGSELGLDPGSDLVVLEQSILSQDPSLAGERELLEPSAECPWKGLSSYASSDQDAFFGRSAEIAAALARLERHQLLVLTGPSGSGKSSLMLAGLAPALTRRSRTVVAFTPGVDPPVAMATACLGVPGDPVLLVDQFEETFTLAGPDNDPGAWLGELARYAETRASVVVTLRADQMVHLTVEQDFARMAEQGVLLVAPLEGRALREAIEEPARRAGVRLEHGLVDLMIRDTEGQPGALPLLSHALVETWRRREHGLLTVEGYRDSGGLRGAVAASADRLYESLTDVERAQLRRLMLRMVSVSDGGEPVRSLLPASSVAEDPARQRVLDRLARARLVTTGKDSFELAHEALARAWPRLRTWLSESAEEQQLVRHLSASAAGWDALGRPHSELYRGARLQGATEWLARADADPDTPGARVPRRVPGASGRRPRWRRSGRSATSANRTVGCGCCSPGWPRSCSSRPGWAWSPSTAAAAAHATGIAPRGRQPMPSTSRWWAGPRPPGPPTAPQPPCSQWRPTGPARTPRCRSPRSWRRSRARRGSSASAPCRTRPSTATRSPVPLAP